MILATILIVFLSVFFLICNHAYKHSVHYNKKYLTTSDIRRGVPNDIQLAVFGSTYTKYGFNSFSELELQGFNFSLDAEPLECDLKLLEKYESHIAPNAVVVFTLAACAACSKYEEVVKLNPINYYQVLGIMKVPHCILSLKNIIKYYLPLLFRPTNVKYIVMGGKIPNDVAEVTPYIVSSQKRKSSIEQLVNVWLKMFKLKDLKDSKLPNCIVERISKNTNVLSNLIEYSINKGYRPAIVVLPLSGSLNDYFSDAFVESTLGRMVKTASDKNKIPCFDYRKHSDFQNEDSFYIDGGFRLSKIGSLHLTKLVYNDLINAGYTLSK